MPSWWAYLEGVEAGRADGGHDPGEFQSQAALIECLAALRLEQSVAAQIAARKTIEASRRRVERTRRRIAASQARVRKSRQAYVKPS